MSAKHPLKLVALRSRNDLLSKRKRYSLCRLGMLGMNPTRGGQNNAVSLAASPKPTRWHLQVDVERAKEDPQISLPLLMYVYSPWHLVINKFSLWKLKIFWDWEFSEVQFIENAKHAVVLITKLISEQREQYIKQCTTPMGYKQILHDIAKLHRPQTQDWPKKLLRFEKRHIRRAILLKLQQLPHYDHKFAFVDVVFLACRRANDFDSTSDIEEMGDLINRFAKKEKHFLVPYPVVFAEFFVRFRRDYSMPASERTGQWLVSTYKILKLDMLNYHPEFSSGSQSIYQSQPA
ncbi:uncharacterized protein LOC133844067 [Drosophila sulfurigaster albostrigata]|uniref:uncharacterized protein LOC133844067 n=1 Tax=Drosophila sulfurigaster albostrigata TaxID=89887 RepID=UPI002D2196D8|nr:uncharacterized protein LOC133844067 [Drosophila sulfurigaster albostrigata]